MTGVASSVPRGVDMTTSGTTTDDYVAALTWEVPGLGKKQIWLSNTGDVTILPDVDELITEKEWAALVEKHGSEEATVKALDCDDARPAKKIEGGREEGDWRYEPEEVDDARSRTGT